MRFSRFWHRCLSVWFAVGTFALSTFAWALDSAMLDKFSDKHSRTLEGFDWPKTFFDATIYFQDQSGYKELITPRQLAALAIEAGTFDRVLPVAQDGSVGLVFKLKGVPSHGYLFRQDFEDLFLTHVIANGVATPVSGLDARIYAAELKEIVDDLSSLATPAPVPQKKDPLHEAREREIKRQAQIHKDNETIRNSQRAWAQALADHIGRRWLRTPGLDPNLSARVQIHLTTEGEVEQVVLLAKSGNKKFDNTVLNAIHKASPLPLPTDPRAFNPILQPTFTPDSFQ